MKVFEDEKDKLLAHEYDGIRELDNHMPVWWLWLFYFTIAFAVVYLVYYEVTGWGPDQYDEYKAEVAAAEAKYGKPDQDEAVAFDWAVLTEPDALEAGKKLFHSSNQLCFTCHGDNAQGLVGPNLTDDYWLHGCGIENIAASIRHGYPEKGMLPYGSGNKLSNEQVQQLASYVISLHGTEPADAKAPDLNRAKKCEENGAGEKAETETGESKGDQ